MNLNDYMDYLESTIDDDYDDDYYESNIYDEYDKIQVLREAVEDKFINDELDYEEYAMLIDRLDEREMYLEANEYKFATNVKMTDNAAKMMDNAYKASVKEMRDKSEDVYNKKVEKMHNDYEAGVKKINDRYESDVRKMNEEWDKSEKNQKKIAAGVALGIGAAGVGTGIAIKKAREKAKKELKDLNDKLRTLNSEYVGIERNMRNIEIKINITPMLPNDKKSLVNKYDEYRKKALDIESEIRSIERRKMKLEFYWNLH